MESPPSFLAFRFPPELISLRLTGSGNSAYLGSTADPQLLHVGDTFLVKGLQGHQMEVRASFPPVHVGASEMYGVSVLSSASADGSYLVESTRIGYSPYWRALIVDRTSSCMDTGKLACRPLSQQHGDPLLRSYPLDISKDGGRLDLVVYVDGSVVEVTANNRTAISTSVLPNLNQSGMVGVFGLGEGRPVALEAHRLRPVY